MFQNVSMDNAAESGGVSVGARLFPEIHAVDLLPGHPHALMMNVIRRAIHSEHRRIRQTKRMPVRPGASSLEMIVQHDLFIPRQTQAGVN